MGGERIRWSLALPFATDSRSYCNRLAIVGGVAPSGLLQQTCITLLQLNCISALCIYRNVRTILFDASFCLLLQHTCISDVPTGHSLAIPPVSKAHNVSISVNYYNFRHIFGNTLDNPRYRHGTLQPNGAMHSGTVGKHFGRHIGLTVTFRPVSHGSKIVM